MNGWQPGQSARFRAQIGIEGDGFLDIDLPISKAGKRQLRENG